MTQLILFTIFLAAFSAQALTFSTAAAEPHWQSVVQIRTEAVDSDGSSVPSFCNGTLLSSRILVTAAHCVHHAEAIGSREIQVDIGYYKYVQKPDGTTVKIGYVSLKKETLPAQFYFTARLKQKIQNSGLKVQIGPEEDIALVVFQKEMSLDPQFQFARIISKSHFDGLKNSVTGYWPSVVTINFFTEMSTDTKRIAQLNQINWQSPSYFKSQSNSRVEEGDSGAPLWARVGTQWKVIGVVKGRAETFFTNWDVFAATDQNLCDISRAFSAEDRALVCF